MCTCLLGNPLATSTSVKKRRRQLLYQYEVTAYTVQAAGQYRILGIPCLVHFDCGYGQVRMEQMLALRLYSGGLSGDIGGHMRLKTLLAGQGRTTSWKLYHIHVMLYRRSPGLRVHAEDSFHFGHVRRRHKDLGIGSGTGVGMV